LLAPVIYGIPSFLSLYSDGDKSLPDMSSHAVFRRIKAQPSGNSNGISSSMQFTLLPTFS